LRGLPQRFKQKLQLLGIDLLAGGAEALVEQLRELRLELLAAQPLDLEFGEKLGEAFGRHGERSPHSSREHDLDGDAESETSGGTSLAWRSGERDLEKRRAWVPGGPVFARWRREGVTLRGGKPQTEGGESEAASAAESRLTDPLRRKALRIGPIPGRFGALPCAQPRRGRRNQQDGFGGTLTVIRRLQPSWMRSIFIALAAGAPLESKASAETAATGRLARRINSPDA